MLCSPAPLLVLLQFPGGAASMLKSPASTLLLLQTPFCFRRAKGLHGRSPSQDHHDQPKVGSSPSAAPTSSSMPLSPSMKGASLSPTWKLFKKIVMKDFIALGPHLSQKPVPVRRGHNFTPQDKKLRSPPTDDISDEEWLAASANLATSLNIDPPSATEPQHRRVFHLYLPVYFWLHRLLASHRLANDGQVGGSAGGARAATSQQNRPGVSTSSVECGRRALVIGISAPQGCGKSSLVEEIRRMLEKDGHPCAVLSIDDFYLSGAEQDTLAAQYPWNPLLQVRGNAGSHDLALGLRTVRLLKYGPEASAADCSRVCSIPRYDKSARGGRGDRTPEEQWTTVATMPEIVLLEGWMLGFEALPDDSPLLGDGGDGENLRVVNEFLKGYQELHDEVDAWLVLKTADPGMVFEWRAEAEERMREAGRPGMSEEQVRDFCARYMPAYRAYLPGLYERALSARRAGDDNQPTEECPSVDGQTGDQESCGSSSSSEGVRVWEEALVIEVGRDRNPIVP